MDKKERTPDWAIELAIERIIKESGAVYRRENYGHRCYPTFTLYCDHIAQFEKPPVDPDLEIAREAAAQWCDEQGFLGGAKSYRDKERDGTLGAHVRAIKLARERGAL